MSDTQQFTVGELKVLLRDVDDTKKIQLVVLDDEARHIQMRGFLDYVIKPKEEGDVLQLYAGGQAYV